MDKLVLIDGNSIVNRAFYGIMGNKMLKTNGMYTNAIYGFLSIYFKIMEDIDPKYVGVAFDLKAPTKRHELYKEYKATRRAMPDELAEQLPVLKDILRAMKVPIIEKEGYEADDILGTLAKYGKKQGLEVTILTGDRDSFQLIEQGITVRIPRTKMGKTEEEDYTEEKIQEEYGVQPIQLIEVKGLMGDSSDNIPGVPGIGEKTALELIKHYKTIDNIYDAMQKGETTLVLKPKVKEKLEANKDLAYLSRTLGTIDTNAPVEKNISMLEKKEWDKEAVFEIFTNLKFGRFIERFGLGSTLPKASGKMKTLRIIELTEKEQISKAIEKIKQTKKMYYYLDTRDDMNPELIVKKKIVGIYLCDDELKTVMYINYKNRQEEFIQDFGPVLESNKILKCGERQKRDICLLKQMGIEPQKFMFDVSIAAYLLNSTSGHYSIDDLGLEYLNLDFSQIESISIQSQMNLFEVQEEKTIDERKANYVYGIYKLHDKLKRLLQKEDLYDLFKNVEMPLAEVLADMQYTGVYVDKEALKQYGKELTDQLQELKQEIYELAGGEFNINSTKQLGEILFEELELPVQRKNKKGYSTDSEVLEKLKGKHPIIEKLLEYRKITKLNSTYVEGVIPFINPRTHRIHSVFHQTVTATGRISSTEPNLQNIPTRNELGQKIRMAFMPESPESTYLDADYSQIELRVLAHVSHDETMIEDFIEGHDIHVQVASKVFNVPTEEVTKELRRKAKAVNFGIVYGISDFGLGEQLGVGRKEAKQYIEQYLEKYHGIAEFMENVTEQAREKGYEETILHRRRYIPELASNNYMVRQFGARVAMNAPIQGTGADIMKIAMIQVYQELKKENLRAKLVLQVHDELIVEAPKEEKEKVKNILKNCMENAIKLVVPLVVEVGEGQNWYEAK